MSVMEQLMEKSRISRRSFLQTAGALSATAALYGCGGGEAKDQAYEPIVAPQDDLVFDRTVKEIMGTHPHNCGGRCPFKFSVKGFGTSSARIVKCTSDGDISRADSIDSDESIEMPQIRGCVRGYAQVKRTYSPDRIKYPLIQTKKRGDVSGFRRATWDEALDKVADMIAATVKRYKKYGGTLDYIPMVAGPSNGMKTGMVFAGMFAQGFAEGAGSALIQYFGPAILPAGSPSFENMLFATIGSCGLVPGLAGGNQVLNYQKSNFIIQWGADPSVKEPNKTLFLTKAKEAGVPIVTIDARFTDTAAQQSTGFAKYNLPAYIKVRPQTDSAIAVAMAYTIYKNNWHDDAFIKANCFGFYPTQGAPVDSDGKPFTVVAPAPYPGYLLEPTDFSFSKMLTPDKHPLAGMYAPGENMHVPPGMSFVEYLDSLGVEKYKEVNKTDDLSGASIAAKKDAVITWASNLSGVAKDTILNFADAFAHAGEVFLENGNNGGQKTNNGMHSVWMMICLAGMCGHTKKIGGNLGVNSADTMFNPVTFKNGLMYPILGKGASTPAILVNSNSFVDLVFTGRDNRTKSEFYNDIKSINGIDLPGGAADPKLEIDMVLGAYHITNSINTCPNTNKALNAFTVTDASGGYKIKHYVLYEQFMTPTAAHADIILPAASHHEQAAFLSGQATFYQNQLINPMYDTMADVDIDIALAKKLQAKGIAIDYSRGGKTDEELLESIWNDVTVPDGFTKPSFADLKKNGKVEMKVAQSSGYNPMTGLPFLSETGKLQYYSPFYNYRNGGIKNQEGDHRVYPAVRYMEPFQGYDKILKNQNVGVKGIAYPLQFTTKHARNRAHTVYDNVPMIRDQFDYPKRGSMNPVDAAKRGISDGDTVYIYNDWGCMKVNVSISNRTGEGVVELPHGVWYRASTDANDTYEAWFDLDMGNSVGSKTATVTEFDNSGKPVQVTKTFYKYVTKVDVGGCENVLTHDKDQGPRDPLCGQIGNNHFNGNLCEVSKIKPA